MKEGGFTLIETIISFTIFVMIASLFPLIVQVIDTNKPDSLSLVEGTLTLNQLAMEVREARDIRVVDHQLILELADGKEVSFKQRGERIRRQVNTLGNDIIARKIKDVNFQLVHHGVVITLIDLDDNVFQRRMSMGYDRTATR
ncbi:ComGF family competence protein [Desertibacillus haloalkaliphilus]|uniref:ComGF family competence protein n=1 Tax=Desertibacillus haloalkaliphilus TaxID=1328930 RepID=UPI001C26C297|nr:ComGF family competence protein [Desertibacillus haloalkaliphilus]MBU8908982.1 ComGF family competence protein [Desertibacillus haloalkaliphilus]